MFILEHYVVENLRYKLVRKYETNYTYVKATVKFLFVTFLKIIWNCSVIIPQN